VTRRIRKYSQGWTGNVRSRIVGRSLRVVPFWEAPYARADRINLIIDPGPSFGAGDHPTTLMALELMEEAIGFEPEAVSSSSMLDVGTGTGILAIAARRLGTGFIVALDIDSAAVFTARRNVSLNRDETPFTKNDDDICFIVGGIEALHGSFDLVAANLAAPTLLRICDDLSASTGSFLVLSGIAVAMRDSVVECFAGKGLRMLRTMEVDGWTAALWKRSVTVDPR
jgi:ribosomal protein L11 methyltransferase